MRRLLCLLAASFVLPAHAVKEHKAVDWSNLDIIYDHEETPWEEIQAKLPSTPKKEDLVPFVVDATSIHKFSIDSASLAVGSDGVVHYTVVIESAQGAKTINFEGMRCTTGERKIYAFGRPDGAWSRNKYSRWEPIKSRQQAGYHRELFYSYLCAGGEGMPVLERIQYRLKSGGYKPNLD